MQRTPKWQRLEAKRVKLARKGAKVEAKQLSDKVVEWLQAKPVSNGLAILLAVLIIIID